jgi:hypothetical protein
MKYNKKKDLEELKKVSLARSFQRKIIHKKKAILMQNQCSFKKEFSNLLMEKRILSVQSKKKYFPE